jgi:integrase
MTICNIKRQAIQEYVSSLMQTGYAPKTIDHIHDVLSALLRTAVKWGHLSDNPAHGVDLPRLRTVKPKWALTTAQAEMLLVALPPLPRTMVGVALLSGLRRGELFSLRWRDLDESTGCLTVREAVYEGKFDTPKTAAGRRRIPLAATAWRLLREWRPLARADEPDALVFSTGSGKPISPNNMLRQWVFPACDSLKLSRGELAHLPAHVRVVGARQGRGREGRGPVDGPCERGHDAQRVHAGARRIGADCGRDHRRRIVHKLFTKRRDDGADALNF